MNRMLALYPDDVKLDFVFRGLFLRRLPVEMRAHLLRESIDDPIEMAPKADELHQNRVSSAATNILADSSDDALVNTVTNRVRVPPRSGAASNPHRRRSPTLLREKVSDPRALALKADELYQSRVSPSSVNLLADNFGESLHVKLVSSRARTPKTSNYVKVSSCPYLIQLIS